MTPEAATWCDRCGTPISYNEPAIMRTVDDGPPPVVEILCVPCSGHDADGLDRLHRVAVVNEADL